MLTTITITARDLDTDDRTTLEVEADVSAAPGDQRAGLVQAVRAVHPEARIRSFANGAATFLDRQHLVVASYAAIPKRGESRRGSSAQESLFGEAA
jgi:hypothetical protein